MEGARLRRTHNNGGRMPAPQVQPLNTPTASELTKAHDFLYEADLLVTDVVTSSEPMTGELWLK